MSGRRASDTTLPGFRRLSHRCGTAVQDLDCVGDATPPVLRVHYTDAVPGLDQAELDPLAAEGDDAVGLDVEADRDAGDLNLHLLACGIDPADDPV
jgi:hypothetical protein